MIRIMTYILSR